ncbi:acyltransferase family protein [Acidicapsa dinghuensis]|uniref:Acyltransferase family protein n=1 Tax=Acidicapsa dinghuensis TaxID=2218256 RepID=A0ABW1EB14_9BACT|nr:acyltransferase [Acidicapsa dinghuensis]
MKPGRIRELDGWRGVSILLVLMQHMALFAFPVSAKGTLGFWVHREIFVAGGLGVFIFFCISGFVITRLLILEEAERGSVSLKGFYTRRFLRIIPVFYCFLATVLLLSWAGCTPTEFSWAAIAGLFLHDFIPLQHPDWFVGHSWSLSVEEQFYLALPPLWVLLSGSKRTKFLFAGLAFMLLWGLIIQWGHLGRILSAGVVLGFSCISVGALMAVFEDRLYQIVVHVHPMAVIAGALLLISPMDKGGIQGSIYALIGPFAIGLMLMYTMCRPGWPRKVLNWPGLQWIGLISYSLYLWQEIFTGSFDRYGTQRIAAAFHAGAFLLMIPVAALSFYYIERPCTRMGRRLSDKFSIRAGSASVNA